MRLLKRYAVLLAVLVFFSLAGQGQVGDIFIPKEKTLFWGQKLDQLQALVKANTIKGKVNIYSLCQIDGHTSYSVIGANITFSKIGLELTGQRRNSFLNMHFLSELAHDFYFEQKYDSASWYWNRALDTAIANRFDGEELHGIRMALNNNCFLIGDYTGAMQISTAGLAKSEQIGDMNRMAHFNNVIGCIYMKLGDSAKSGIYFHNHLENALSINDSFEVAHALYNLGDLHILKKKYDEALSYFEQSLNKYLTIKDRGLFNPNERKGFICNKLAQCWKLKGNLERAVKFMHISLIIGDTTKGVNEYDKAEYLVNGADIYNRLNRPDSALVLLRKGLRIATHINHREFKRDALEQIAIAFSQKREFDSAFIYQNRFSTLKDSIDNEISREEIYQRDADLQVERQIQLQKIALQRQRTWRNIILGVAAFLLLTVGFLYNRYRLKQKNRYQKELNRQQNELFNAIAVTQDQERKRIAEDIHDSLGSILSAAKLKLSALRESQPAMAEEHLENYLVAMQLMDEASVELRNISHNIMPATLSKLGLIAALRNLINNISSHPVAIGSGMSINFSAHDFAERVDEKTEMSIYRIVLELINNIVKHARATKVTVQLIRYPDYINLSVEDNGLGFDYENELQAKKGIGLGNILSRVDYLKGKINVDAAPGRGTTVIIDIPYAAT